MGLNSPKQKFHREIQSGFEDKRARQTLNLRNIFTEREREQETELMTLT